MDDAVLATYLIETPHSIDHAVDVLSGEQSSGTFVQVPGETDDLRARHRARVVDVQSMGEADTPALPGRYSGSRFRRARVTIAFPLVNMGTNLPTLLATVAGNLFELNELSGVRLADVELPGAFADAYPGPAFGISGTRAMAGVRHGPLLGTIIKPSVGLSPAATADLVRELADAGIDFIKDDELMADPPHSPLRDRVRAVMGAINDVAERTGKKVMYAFNISDELDAMRRHHDVVLEAGGTCIMLSLNHVGPVGVSAVRAFSRLPIHGHRNGWGMLTRHPFLGMEFRAYQKVWRLLGVDHLHVNGLQNKFWEPDDSVVRSIEAMMEPLLGGYWAMPVISSGQWGGQAPDQYRRTGTADVMYLAGGGIMAHPGGPAAGLRALRQAWDAAMQGVSLDEYAQDHQELTQALETFGQRVRA